MQKSVILLGLSLGCFVLSACSEDKVERDLSNITPLEVHSHALKTRTFEDLPGEPWPALTEFKSHLLAPAAPTGRFGSRMAVGDLDGNNELDLVVTENTFSTDISSSGRVYVYRNVGSSSEELPLVMTDPAKLGLGVALLVGPYCMNGEAGDSMIVSSPGANGFNGVIDVVRLDGGTLNVTKSIKNSSPGMELAGRNLAVGDLNGDGKLDLVVLKTPTDAIWLNARLGIVLDFCSAGEDLVFDVELDSGAAGRNYGWSIYVEDLDNTGDLEIIVSEENYGDSNPRQGALHFYKYVEEAGVKSIIKSRDTLVGPTNSGLRAVTFADIDGDTDLDLIVGLVTTDHNGTQRNGSARTLTNDGPGVAFDMDAPADWRYENPAGSQYFGTALLAVDLNNDGVRDLVAGSPGRDTNSTVSKAVSSIAVFLGTSDGSVFSQTPYWHHHSNAGTRPNDELGRVLAVGNVNNSGWLDVFGAARSYNKSGASVDGRVLNFLSTADSCYRADKCLVKGICHDKGDVSPGNACLVCDPLKRQFWIRRYHLPR